jgi:REP-associated tyrosine transposase
VVVESDRAAARDYLGARLDYVHLNPVRAGLVAPGKGKGLLDCFWSSLAQGYAVAGRQRRPWIETEVGFELAGFAGTASGRKRLVETLERRASEEKGRTLRPPRK